LASADSTGNVPENIAVRPDAAVIVAVLFHDSSSHFFAPFENSAFWAGFEISQVLFERYAPRVHVAYIVLHTMHMLSFRLSAYAPLDKCPIPFIWLYRPVER
jgi:hypothetical protein